MFRRIALVSLLAVSALGATSGTVAAKSSAITHSGSCSGATDWKLKIKPDNGRIEVEFEVDQNRNNRLWKVVMARTARSSCGPRATPELPPVPSRSVGSSRTARARTGSLCGRQRPDRRSVPRHHHRHVLAPSEPAVGRPRGRPTAIVRSARSGARRGTVSPPQEVVVGSSQINRSTHRMPVRRATSTLGTLIMAGLLAVACQAGGPGAGSVAATPIVAPTATAPASPSPSASATTAPTLVASPTATAEAAAVDPSADGLDVTFGEFAITLEADEIRPGPVTLVVHNAGEMTHGFEMKIESSGSGSGSGRDRKKIETRTFHSGETLRVEADLSPGTYEIECYVDGHASKGMRTTITVKANAPLVTRSWATRHRGTSGSSSSPSSPRLSTWPPAARSPGRTTTDRPHDHGRRPRLRLEAAGPGRQLLRRARHGGKPRLPLRDPSDHGRNGRGALKPGSLPMPQDCRARTAEIITEGHVIATRASRSQRDVRRHRSVGRSPSSS